MRNWIEKRMDVERSAARTAFKALGWLSAVVALILCYVALSPVLDGVYTLDTLDKVQRFSQREYMDGVLRYRSSFDMMQGVVITSPQYGPLSWFSSDAQPDSTKETNYNLYRLAGDGYSVLYLTEGLLDDTGAVHVQTLHRDLKDALIREYAPNGSNVFVLYEAGSPVPFLSLTGFFMLLTAALFGLTKSGFVRRRTDLGRQIAALGSFRKICREIDRQAERPLFDASGVTVLEGWLLFRTFPANPGQQAVSSVVPIADVLSIDIAPDREHPEVFVCSFNIRGWGKSQFVHLEAQHADELNEVAKGIAARAAGISM